MKNNANEKLVSVEIWDENIGWQSYDCPDNGDTVKSYADWCVGEESNYWATVNSIGDKIRLNGWHVVDGSEIFKDDEEVEIITDGTDSATKKGEKKNENTENT